VRVAVFASIGLALHVEVHAELLSLTTVALTGDAAPGTGETFSGFIGSGALDAAGRVAFAARTTTGQGVWRQNPGLGKVAITGDAAPGTAAAFTIFPGSPGLGALGTAFFGGLTGGGQGIWKQSPGLEKVAVTGDAAPGTATTFSGFRVPAVNDLGHAAISGRLNGGGEGVWKESSALAKVAVTGDPAPGTARTFTLLEDSPAINASDHTAFKGTTLDGSGIWKESPALGKVAVAGDAAPGTSNTFFSFGSPSLNDLDHTAFIGFLSTGPTGIWKEDPTLRMVAAVGDAAPGTTEAFSGLRDAPFLNNSGHVAFFAELTGGGEGIWAEDRFGALSLVARSGDDIEVRPGDFRTIRFLLVGGLNDSGAVAFRADFFDGSEGVFVASPVPEPASAALITMGSLAVARRSIRPRRRSSRRHVGAVLTRRNRQRGASMKCGGDDRRVWMGAFQRPGPVQRICAWEKVCDGQPHRGENHASTASASSVPRAMRPAVSHLSNGVATGMILVS